MTKRVAIIGAGPAGVAMANAVALEPNADSIFSKIDVFERHAGAGGLWYYTSGNKSHLVPPIPSTNQKDAVELTNTDNIPPEDRFVSAMYQHLETNIVKDLMKYKDFPFPESCEMFPSRQEVAKYIQDFTATIPDVATFKYNTNVVSLTKKNGEWEIVYEDVSKTSDNIITAYYDYVILAQGHFDLPYIPDVSGLKSWSEKDISSITHAKYFNNVENYENKTVLVIGNSASGLDISTQLSTYARKVIVSSTSASPVADITIEGVDQLDRVIKYDFDDNRSITTESGKKIDGIDSVIFCTGYLYKIPFLKSYIDGEQAIITNGDQVRYLYKQIFYIPDPTLINAALPKNIIPFPFSQCQAQYVARVITGRCQLPSTDEMLKEYKSEVELKGEGKSFHDLGFPKDAEYCESTFDWIKGTEDEGFVADRWEGEKTELRGRTAALKAVRLEKIVDHANILKKKHEPFYLLRGELQE